MKKTISFIMIMLITLGILNCSLANNEKGVRNESLKGRGYSDSGREEPQYVGIIGYVVVGSKEADVIKKTREFDNEKLWMIPTYKRDKQFWNEDSEKIPHKTEVVVIDQSLSHIGYGGYSGYLLVERLDNGKQFYINVMNYVTVPYWTFDNPLESASFGVSIAEYHQVSDYYPIDNHGYKGSISEGQKVLIVGKAGLSRYVKPSTNGVTVITWRTLNTININENDLVIIY